MKEVSIVTLLEQKNENSTLTERVVFICKDRNRAEEYVSNSACINSTYKVSEKNFDTVMIGDTKEV